MKKMILALVLMGFFKAGLAQVSTIDPEANKIIGTSRPDGRYLSTNGFVHQQIRELNPMLQFNPGISRDEFTRWQAKVRNKVRDLMQFPIVTPQPSPKLISKVKRKGYTVEKWEIFPQDESVVPILMLIPDGVSASKPAPAVLCYPGSYRSKEELAGEPELEPRYKVERSYDKNHMAKFYAEKGIVAIAIDNPGIAELSDLERNVLAPSYAREGFSRYLIDMGWHYMGYSAFNGHQVLNWLRKLDFVDAKRLALSGHSLGTEPVMMLAALNPDIKAVVFNDFLTNTIRRVIVSTKPNEKGIRPSQNALTHCVPGLWRWVDYVDILASLAPMHLLITEGGVTMDLKAVQKAYAIAGAAKNYEYRYYKKYENTRDRIGDEAIPEGLDDKEFFHYANVDAPNHYFKGDIAVPWLSSLLSSK